MLGKPDGTRHIDNATSSLSRCLAAPPLRTASCCSCPRRQKRVPGAQHRSRTLHIEKWEGHANCCMSDHCKKLSLCVAVCKSEMKPPDAVIGMLRLLSGMDKRKNKTRTRQDKQTSTPTSITTIAMHQPPMIVISTIHLKFKPGPELRPCRRQEQTRQS